MKNLLFFLFSIIYFLFSTKPVQALYDPRTLPNNKVGVHILSLDEISRAAALVNSSGGDWGYVTVPIQPSERDLPKWQSFMDQARTLHLIPLVRITTVPQGGTWAQGENTDLVDFANFLSELHWPVENRYIVLFNEVNRDAEWGGTVDPAKYAEIVKNARTIFKERSTDFFLLGPALDLSLPNSRSSQSATSYLRAMAAHDPLIWSYFDGWASHSYPNPAFQAHPTKTGLTSIVGYRSEFSLLKLATKPVFITETGWDQNKVSDSLLNSYWTQAWQIWNQDYNVVAVTPFILSGGDMFSPFSLLDEGGNYRPSGQAIANLAKSAGTPTLAPAPTPPPTKSSQSDSTWETSLFKPGKALFKLENIFRVVLGLPVKASIALRNIALDVELAQNSSQWERGLSHRASLGSMDGMLFIFPRAHVPIFWMKDMSFPIDMIWLNDGIVIDITHNVPLDTTDHPETYSPNTPVNMVLETDAGWAQENNIQVGDRLVIND